MALQRLLAYGAARLGGVPEGFARGVSRELASETERLASEPNRGRVIADGPIAAAALARLARRRPVVYNAHNLESGFRHELDRGTVAGIGGQRTPARPSSDACSRAPANRGWSARPTRGSARAVPAGTPAATCPTWLTSRRSHQ